jgi:hypothetical protein
VEGRGCSTCRFPKIVSQRLSSLPDTGPGKWSHGGERLVAWADRSDAGADGLVPEVDEAFGSADSLPVFARGDGRIAVNRLACRDEGPLMGLTAKMHKTLIHKIRACAIMRRNLDINPLMRGLISKFSVEVSGSLS